MREADDLVKTITEYEKENKASYENKDRDLGEVLLAVSGSKLNKHALKCADGRTTEMSFD